MNSGVRFFLDGEEVEAHPGETIWGAARRLDRHIPHLCHREAAGFEPDGNCRACVVEIEGEAALTPSCKRQPTPGMKVSVTSTRAVKARKMVIELLLADRPPAPGNGGGGELGRWARMVGARAGRFPAKDAPAADASHPAILFDPANCIHCGLCLRACRQVQSNDVIGMSGRGSRTRITFDLGDPLGESTCVGCGECVQACPTDALLEATAEKGERTADSVCPYCGVGCQTVLHIKGRRIVKVEGRDGPANRGRLCVKGRFGMDYVNHPHRLTHPLVRRQDAAKEAATEVDPADPSSHFREASWEEALDRAARGFLDIRQRHGGDALGGLGTAKGSNEEGYLFQKLVRTGFYTNNVDHCARLCHAASVAALMETIGSGAVTVPFGDCAKADVILVIGATPSVNHPVAATFIKDAAKAGATLIVIDPRGQPLDRFATHALRPKPGTDVALLNAMMRTIIEEGLEDRGFIEARTTGFDDLARHLEKFAPEAVAGICGIDAQVIRAVSRLFAGAERAIVFWGMGITQHVHGTNNARCLAALAMITGQVGRPGSGLHPLRGQNNVQGASDVGILPPFLPGYQRVDDEEARVRFQTMWQKPIPSRPGLTVVEMLHGALEGEIKGLLIMGENPAISDPDINTVRRGLAALDHLVVQDIFLTETAMFADVVLPASAQPEKTGTYTNTNRQVQLARQALEPPGEARQDWWILQELARRLDLDWNYAGPEEAWEEMRGGWSGIRGISWERLERQGCVTHPCTDEGAAGQPVLMGENFNTPDGRGRLVPVDIVSPDELPDQEYPMVLTTGRLLEHWHTGAMSRRAAILDRLEPSPVVHLAPADLARLGIEPGEPVKLTTRRGTIEAPARADATLPAGVVFAPFCFAEAPANALTNAALDPVAKIPEYKFCAVRAEKPGA